MSIIVPDHRTVRIHSFKISYALSLKLTESVHDDETRIKVCSVNKPRQ